MLRLSQATIAVIGTTVAPATLIAHLPGLDVASAGGRRQRECGEDGGCCRRGTQGVSGHGIAFPILRRHRSAGGLPRCCPHLGRPWLPAVAA